MSEEENRTRASDYPQAEDIAAGKPAKGRVWKVVVLLVVLALAAAAGGLAWADSQKAGRLTATVNAEGYDPETSTPVGLSLYEGDVAALLNDGDGSNDPEPIDEATGDANQPIELEAESQGTYTVAVSAAPILEDGTVYAAPDAQAVELGRDDASLVFECEPLDLEAASEDEIEKAAEAAEQAAKDSGDEDKAAAAAATNAAAQRQETANSAGSSGASSSSSGGSSSSGKSAASSSKAGSSSGSSSSSSKSTSSGSSGGSSSSGSNSSGSASQHTHSWVYHAAVTKQEPVYETRSYAVCNACGAKSPGRDHMKAHAMAGEKSSTHTEYEEVQTGTRTVTVQAAYYSCSCGATKSA